VPAWESSRSNNARAYRLNPAGRYLLIRHGESEKSLVNHEGVTMKSESSGTNRHVTD
jgi:hypothetical protein